MQWIENRGQWPAVVTHRAESSDATIWLERGSILIDRFDGTAMEAMAHAHVGAERSPERIRHHAVRLNLVGAQAPSRIEAIGVKRGAYHFIHGEDPAHWMKW